MDMSNMRQSNSSIRKDKMICVLFWAMVIPRDVDAYIDPGTTGMLSQVLYVLFYGALGIFLYMLRYIKQYMDNFKQFIGRLLGRRP
jgi:hypothetical protein